MLSRKQLEAEELQLMDELKEIRNDFHKLINNRKEFKADPVCPIEFQAILKQCADVTSMLKVSSDIAKSVNDKVLELDIARNRVSECQHRVHDLLDLKLCSEGVKNALNAEDFEQAAAHIHRFYSMDVQLLKKTADEINQDCTAVNESLLMLRESASKLLNTVTMRFKEAVSVSDRASVERFFKLFPMLDKKEYGLEQFSNYLAGKLKESLEEKLKPLLDNNASFTDALTVIFEEIAREIEANHPLIETYYGPGNLETLIGSLQREGEKRCGKVLSIFRQKCDMKGKLNAALEMVPKSQAAVKAVNTKETDALLNEITRMHSRYSLYTKFVQRRLNNDLESADVGAKAQVWRKLEHSSDPSSFCCQMQELISEYLRLERHYLEQCVKKAVAMDDLAEGDALQTNLPDDAFFICKKCARRAYVSGSIDATCAVTNNACAILETEVCPAIRAHLKQGYATGYLDLTQAYNAMMLQGRLQQPDAEQSRAAFLAHWNDSDICLEYAATLCQALHEEIVFPNENDAAKYESCLTGFSSVTVAFASVNEYGLRQIRSSVVKPRVMPWVDNFLTHSHQLSPDEFSSYDANEPFARNLILNLESLLWEFKNRLTAGNYDAFVSAICEEVIAQWERNILKIDFNQLGGLALDKEIRAVAGFLSNAASHSIREKFARLSQIGAILNLEKVGEIYEFCNEEGGGDDKNGATFNWRMAPKEIKQFLTLRKDFRPEDIRRLKL